MLHATRDLGFCPLVKAMQASRHAGTGLCAVRQQEAAEFRSHLKCWCCISQPNSLQHGTLPCGHLLAGRLHARLCFAAAGKKTYDCILPDSGKIHSSYMNCQGLRVCSGCARCMHPAS